MKARLKTQVRLRAEDFGGTVYVHERNDFFFLDKRAFALVEAISNLWTPLGGENLSWYRGLASLGICETAEPVVRQAGYSGTAFVGAFEDIPKVRKPLVVNCFATAHCPLVCRYCHADDLMRSFRDSETESQLDAVIATTRNIDSLVAVVTGGDPLTRVERTRRIIEGIGDSKALVMDTSGVPTTRSDLELLIPVLSERSVHVRVSLDDFEDNNSRARPVNRKYVRDGRTSYSHAEQTIKQLVQARISLTVQTVLSKFNDNPDALFDFARVLIGWGVRNWVIHITVVAGKAREVERNRSSKRTADTLLPEEGGLKTVRKLHRLIQDAKLSIDLRVTNANPIKHAVFLVSSNGDLYTEGMAKLGKKLSFAAHEVTSESDLWKDVDAKAHTARYSNWVTGIYPEKSLSELCLNF